MMSDGPMFGGGAGRHLHYEGGECHPGSRGKCADPRCVEAMREGERKRAMRDKDWTLKAVAGEGGVYMMVDEANQRTYKPGQLTDTGEREANGVLIARDAAGNRYRWTLEAWRLWNDQLSDSMKRAAS